MFDEILKKAVTSYYDNDLESTEKYMEEFLTFCQNNSVDPVPHDLNENPTLWYELLIDTKLYNSPSTSPVRILFEKAAKLKFDEVPSEELRGKFMAGLNDFFPASDV